MPYTRLPSVRWYGLRTTAKACLVLGGMAIAPLTMAQSSTPGSDVDGQASAMSYSAASVVSDGALSGVNGAVTINIASGDHNLQNNSGAIAIGSAALADNIVVQRATARHGLAPGQANVSIKEDALSRSSGWISVNQVAGTQNVQSNTMSVALGVRGSSLTSESLSQVLSGGSGQEQGSDDSRSSRRDVEVGSSTFRGTTGVVQVNQSAGRGNTTRNNFSLRMGRN